MYINVNNFYLCFCSTILNYYYIVSHDDSKKGTDKTDLKQHLVTLN